MVQCFDFEFGQRISFTEGESRKLDMGKCQVGTTGAANGICSFAAQTVALAGDASATRARPLEGGMEIKGPK